MTTRLSKSWYLSGLPCPKRLYLEIHARELATPFDEGTQAILDTGTEVGELARERYPGGLSAVEDDFARAMTAFAGRRRRRRRLAAAAGLVLVTALAVAMAALWQRSERSARRVEARRLYQLGREAVERSPPEALAHAIASLQTADSTDTRRLALDAIERSPMPMVIPEASLSGLPVGVEFSFDGRWLAVSQIKGDIALLGDGGDTVASWKAAERPTRGHFTPDSRAVVTTSIGDRSPPSGRCRTEG